MNRGFALCALCSAGLVAGAFACTPRSGPIARQGWPIVIESPGESDLCSPKALSVDDGANVYLLGVFSGKIDFDPAPATAWRTTTKDALNCFVAKYSSSGALMWCDSFGSFENGLFLNDLACDGQGNVYATGRCSQESARPGDETGASATGVLLKLDAHGKVDRQIDLVPQSGQLADFGEGTAVAWKSGSVFLGGNFDGELDFDPGEATTLKRSNGDRDCFVCRFDDEGELKWVRTWGGQSKIDFLHSICTDDAGNLYAAGALGMWESLVFDTGLVISPGPDTASAGSFLARIDKDGEVNWVRTWGGKDPENYCSAMDVAASRDGTVYVFGQFKGQFTIDIRGEEVARRSNGAQDVFLAAFDSDGSAQWALAWGGETMDYAKCLDLGSHGEIQCTGSYQVPIDFDPGPNATILAESFVAIFDTRGEFQNVQLATGGGARTVRGDTVYSCLSSKNDPLFHHYQGLLVESSENRIISLILKEALL